VREAPARIQLAARSSCGPQIDDAVKRFLSEKYGIDASSLVAVGCGKAQLKNTSDPVRGRQPSGAGHQHERRIDE
jgi:hypothetical protein